MTEKIIKIKCTGTENININDIKEFQGNLKKRTDIDIELIIKSIQKYGFSFPFYIWKNKNINYCLDGHGRIIALKSMQQDGYILPEFPAVYIKAKTKAEAKNKLLRLNSQYGQVTSDGIIEFMDDTEFKWEELKMYNQELLISPIEEYNFDEEWIGMPAFEKLEPIPRLIIDFKTEEERESFVKLNKIKIRKKGATVWNTNWPYDGNKILQDLKYED